VSKADTAEATHSWSPFGKETQGGACVKTDSGEPCADQSLNPHVPTRGARTHTRARAREAYARTRSFAIQMRHSSMDKSCCGDVTVAGTIFKAAVLTAAVPAHTCAKRPTVSTQARCAAHPPAWCAAIGRGGAPILSARAPLVGRRPPRVFDCRVALLRTRSGRVRPASGVSRARARVDAYHRRRRDAAVARRVKRKAGHHFLRLNAFFSAREATGGGREGT